MGLQSIVFLPTADLEATDRFYQMVLGLPLVLDQGGCRIYQVGEGFWGFCRREQLLSEPERIVLTLVADAVEHWHGHLTNHGVETDGPPRENADYRIVHFYAKDPNGYRLEIQRFLHPFP